MTDESAGDNESAREDSAGDVNAALGGEDLENTAVGGDDVCTTTPELRAAGKTTETTTTETTGLLLFAHPPALAMAAGDDPTLTSDASIPSSGGCVWVPFLLACAICAGRERRLASRLRPGMLRSKRSESGWMGMRWRPVLRGAGAADDVGPGLRALRFVGSGLTGLIV